MHLANTLPPQSSASLQGSFDSAQDDNPRQKISFSSDSLDQSAPSCRFSVLRKHLVILSAASSNELAESKDPFPLNSAPGSARRSLECILRTPSTAKQCKRAGILRLRCPSRISREGQTPLRMTILDTRPRYTVPGTRFPLIATGKVHSLLAPQLLSRK